MDSRGSRGRGRALGFLTLALGLGLAHAGGAQPLSLADLDAGGTFASLSGDLVFADFRVTTSGDANPDLSTYLVEPLEYGFQIVSALDGLWMDAGEAGSLSIDYSVNGVEGVSLEGATLAFDANASEHGSLAKTTEDFLHPDTEDLLGDVGVFVTGGGGERIHETVALTAPATSLDVVENISVSAAAGGGGAGVFVVDQQFVVVPEPTATLLQLTALAGLGLLARARRTQSAAPDAASSRSRSRSAR